MRLAVRELLRRPGRFTVVGGALTVLVLLLLFLGGLLDGLYLTVAAVVGALVSLRRIVRIDPASAIGAGA